MEDKDQAGEVRRVLPLNLQAEARLKLEQVETLCGWRRSKIYQEVKAGTFPAPEKRGARCSRWRAGDVMDWLRATASSGAAK